MNPTFEQALATWRELVAKRDDETALRLYVDELLTELVRIARRSSSIDRRYDGMIALLGFSPEPAMLTARVVAPSKLILLHTKETTSVVPVVRSHCGLPSHAVHTVEFEQTPTDLDALYRGLWSAVAKCGAAAVLIDVTGGKKLMSLQVGLATPLLRVQFHCDIDLSSVAYGEYWSEIRKPRLDTCSIQVVRAPDLAHLAGRTPPVG